MHHRIAVHAKITAFLSQAQAMSIPSKWKGEDLQFCQSQGTRRCSTLLTDSIPRNTARFNAA